MARSTSLNGSWHLFHGPQLPRAGAEAPGTPGELVAAKWPAIPATVPGNVEIDLMAAGELPEISKGNNILLLRELETHRWWYRRTFASPGIEVGQRVELVFEGLDCLGVIFLNGVEVGRTQNMLIEHRLDVTEHLRTGGENELFVRIDSAILEGRRHENEPIEWADRMHYESISVRKAPHMYGWDITPRLISAGLWRPVRLDVLHPTRLRSVYWATVAVDAGKRTARVFAHWDFVTDRLDIDAMKVRATLRRGGKEVHRTELAVIDTHGRYTIDLTDVELWWPRGYGEAGLYDVAVELIDESGAVVDAHHCRIGLRTVKLVRTAVTTAEKPGEFVFVVNGQKIFCKGTNWVALDALHSRDGQHLGATIDLAVDLNCNMIRCWGGNVYEDHDFFDLCDEHGILVWQDFALACAIYPQTEEFAAKLTREVEAVVRKLRNHPSLALWAGDNEIDVFYHRLLPGIDPNTDKHSRGTLPGVVRRLDPYREYLPSSPYSSPEMVAMGTDVQNQPERHLWGPRDDFKGAFYTGSLAHFASEIGYHGCPDRRTIEEMIDAEHVWPWRDNDQWLTHCTRPHRNFTGWNYRINLMSKQIGILFDAIPDNLDDYVLASQISQAEAKKFFIEWFRSAKWRRTGILWWNLRDGWPIFSDAIVDYYNRKKLAYTYIHRVQRDVCAICCEPSGGRHEIVVVNDTLRPAEGRVTVTDADTSGVLLDAAYGVKANGKASMGFVPQSTLQAMYLLRWDDAAGSYLNHYLAGSRPFKLADYRRWLDKLEIPAGIGSVRMD
ncbi:MAG: hypothetical protein IT442_16655 [Phycisphaeraceae bacterium]|nr:hypothetical protein [Phycisphaeraceae bacterium]